MMKSFDTSFAFRPDVRVIVYNADNVELRSGVWSCNSIIFSDDDRKGILGTIVLGLLEKRSIAEISLQGQISQEEIVSVIEALGYRQAQFLRTRSSGQTLYRSSGQSAFRTGETS